MKDAVLFLTLPYQSHQISCFELARDLQDKGYHIFFTGTESQRELIESEGFFVEPFCKEVSIITTGLSPKKAFGIPPQNSDYIPNESLLSNLYCEILWLKKRMHDNLQWIIHQTCFVFKSDEYFFNRLKFRYQIKGNLTKILTDIILAPENLEFSFRNTYENEVYFHKKSIKK